MISKVIFLHGLGGNGDETSNLFEKIQAPHIKYIFPTAPIRPVTLNRGLSKRSWFDIIKLKPDASQDENGIMQASQACKTIFLLTI